MPKKKMPIPTAKQLPSGMWHVQLRIGKQSIPITCETEKEAVAKAMAIKQKLIQAAGPNDRMTVEEAIAGYIETRENSKSPTTIAGYRVIQRNRFRGIQKLQLRDLTQARWQAAVDAERPLISAKTLKNSAGLVQGAVFQYTGRRLTCSLPQVVPQEHAWLEPRQISKFLEAIRGNKYEIPMLLALSGLRKSEIAALRWKDIDLDENTITVHGSTVVDDDGNLIDRKENKNVSSRRTVYFIVPQLRQAVEAQEREPGDFVYHKVNNVLQKNIDKVCEELGFPAIGVHGLRHTFASLCAHLKIPQNITMEMGGWSDPTVVRKIYTHIARQDVQKEARKFSKFFDKKG